MTEESIRAEHQLDLPLGAVVHCHENYRWVFIGWNHNTVGKNPVFVREVDARHSYSYIADRWEYSCAYIGTLMKKFPDVTKYLKENPNG